MQNFSYLASIQANIDFFLHFFKEKIRIFQETLKRISQNSKNKYADLHVNWRRIFMQNFSFYLDWTF
jgi:hypothetical protein